MNKATKIQTTILVIDDQQCNINLLSNMLSKQGYRVLYFTSGQLALEKINLDLPDLIILDIQMPNIDGYEVCEKLKLNQNTHDIPIIFMSALDQVFDKVKAFQLGGVDYIVKPFDMIEVLGRINTQLKIRFLESQLKEANQKLESLANLDGLTQVANRRCFDEVLEREWKRCGREKQPLSLIMCDVDYFKLYNDFYHYHTGDYCLKIIAKAITEVVKRPADLVTRYGGEKFAIILPNTHSKGARHLGKLVHQKVCSLKIPHERSPLNDYVTLSLGIASMIPIQKTLEEKLIKQADRALHEAKKRGRDRIVCTLS